MGARCRVEGSRGRGVRESGGEGSEFQQNFSNFVGEWFKVFKIF